MLDEAYVLETDGVRLHLWLRGNAASREVMVVLHGGPGSGSACLRSSSGFHNLEERYIVAYYDQRGSGQSYYDLQQGLPAATILNDVAAVVRHTRRRFPEKRLHVWGGSFGAYLAFAYMQQYPAEMASLIAASPVLDFNRPWEMTERTVWLRQYRRKLAPVWRQAVLTRFLAARSPADFFADAAVRSAIFAPETTSKSLKHFCAMYDWLFAAPQTAALTACRSLPLLVLCGGQDPLCREIPPLVAAAANPQLNYMFFPQGGHSLFDEKPSAFSAAISQFIDTLPEDTGEGGGDEGIPTIIDFSAPR